MGCICIPLYMQNEEEVLDTGQMKDKLVVKTYMRNAELNFNKL